MTGVVGIDGARRAGGREHSERRCRSQVPEESARKPARRLSLGGGPGPRPGQGEMDPRASDADVEQPALLIDQRVVVLGLRDRAAGLPPGTAGRRHPTPVPSPDGTSTTRRRHRSPTVLPGRDGKLGKDDVPPRRLVRLPRSTGRSTAGRQRRLAFARFRSGDLGIGLEAHPLRPELERGRRRASSPTRSAGTRSSASMAARTSRRPKNRCPRTR